MRQGAVDTLRRLSKASRGSDWSRMDVGLLNAYIKKVIMFEGMERTSSQFGWKGCAVDATVPAQVEGWHGFSKHWKR